jgi:hypothetical protein
LVAFFATGMFLLSIGGDSLKVAHLGVKFVPIVWLAAILPVSYHTMGVILMVFGVFLMFIVHQVCRRADKRIEAAVPETSESPSFGFIVIAGACIAFAGWWIAGWWFRT